MQGNLTIERDFPRTYREFVERFPSDAACATHLEQLRWPTEFSCPACGVCGAPWRQTRGRPVLSYLSAPDIRDGRHDPRRDPHTTDDLVRGRLASDDRQERCLGQDPGAHAGYQ